MPIKSIELFNIIRKNKFKEPEFDTINGKKAIMFYCINLNDLIQYSSESGMITFSIYPVVLYDDCTIGEALLRDFDNDLQRDKHGNFNALLNKFDSLTSTGFKF